jgi:hypothetical protein
MNFQLPEDLTDLATQLRSFEPQAPKHMKGALADAAAQLEANTRLMAQCAEDLETVATLRVGQMDSQSRVDEIARAVRNVIVDVASRLRA